MVVSASTGPQVATFILALGLAAWPLATALADDGDDGANAVVTSGGLSVEAAGFAYSGGGLVDWQGLGAALLERTPSIAGCVEVAADDGMADEGEFGLEISFTEQGVFRQASIVGPPGSVDGEPRVPSVGGRTFEECVRNMVSDLPIAEHVRVLGSSAPPAERSLLGSVFGDEDPFADGRPPGATNINRYTQFYNVSHAAPEPAVVPAPAPQPTPVTRCGQTRSSRCSAETGAPEPQARTAMRVTIQHLATTDGDNADIRRVVRREQRRIQACLQRVDGEGMTPANGMITASFDLTADGRIADLSLDISDDLLPQGNALSQCLIPVIQRWRFSSPEGDPPGVEVRWRVSVD